jgi:purine-binding chemotaxis protein CheW
MSDSAAAPRATEAAATHTYILFSVAGTTYALRSEQVLHMEMLEHVTPVPNAPAFVEGVVFSRGQVVPVVNLRARFGFERIDSTLRTRLLVVQHEARRVGLLADDAREFVRIPADAVRPPHEAVGGLSWNYLEGVAMIGERIVLVLDLGEVVETMPTAIA